MNILRKAIAFPFVIVGVLFLAIGSVLIYGLRSSADILEDISSVYEGYDD